MSSGSKASSYLRLINFCITQLKAQGPSRTCNERNAEEEATWGECSDLLATAQSFGLTNLVRLGLKKKKKKIRNT